MPEKGSEMLDQIVRNLPHKTSHNGIFFLERVIRNDSLKIKRVFDLMAIHLQITSDTYEKSYFRIS